jgi:epoxyqueuosine reductase
MDGAVPLIQDLKRLALEGGADLFGVADLAPARAFVEEQGGPLITSFPRAISVGMHLSPVMVEQVADRDSVPAIRTYRFYVYQVVNPSLDQISSAIMRRLVQAGYEAYLVPASDIVDKERLRGVFSHKLAAHLAGLGYIGKSCLLVTEKYGARVRFGTVLTDAPLETGTALDRKCGICSRCVEICPVQAFTDVEFRPRDPREVRFDAQRCDRYLDQRENVMSARACGLCVLACDGGR